MIRALFLLVLFPLVAGAQDELPNTLFLRETQPRPLVVMNLAAHPDDEDGNTLAYYRHHENAVAYSVIYTRGEGGQNEAGPELYERLGAIRTAETEAAARILGTQVFFLNFYDFGYSKSADETFAEWSRNRRGFWDTDDPIVGVEEGRDQVTARLVYLIRKLKPDVIFTNHDTLTVGPNTQHGHHQVVGITAYDAFALAADQAFHPEQLEENGVDLWQPKRLFLRQWRQPDGPDVAVPVGDPCPAPPLPSQEDCTEIAVRAAGQHFSQGFDKFAPRFRADTTYFTLLRSADSVADIPQGSRDLAIGLERNAYARRAGAEYFVASGRGFMFDPPSFDVRPLTVVPGQQALLSRADSIGGPLQQEQEMIGGYSAGPETVVYLSGAIKTQLGIRREDGASTPFRIPDNAHLTLPTYRSQYDRSSTGPPVFLVLGYGGMYLPLEVAPPVVVDLDPAPIRLVPGGNEILVQVTTFDPAAEQVQIRIFPRRERGLVEAFSGETVTLSPSDTTAVLHVNVGERPGRYVITIEASASPTSAPSRSYVVTRPAAVLPDIRVAEGLRVGFVRSYDGITENALRAMGAEVTVLDSTALATSDFSQFDTIVLDIRAYLVRPDLREHNQRLLEWVRRGGHLVVGYHKTFEWNPGQSGGFFDVDVVDVPEEGWAPYPLRLGRDRVTREDAPVEVLQPDHVLFRSPHAVIADDWNGWVQERGLYFPGEYDEHYQELVATNDPGEEPLRGGLLLADFGEGTYLYSSLGWYRQLEALNPGAWRLFANLVSLPLTRAAN